MIDKLRKYEKVGVGALLGAAAAGIVFRFYHITQNQFFYYDEGLYFYINRAFLEQVDRHFTGGISNALLILRQIFYRALPHGKPLWSFLIDLRVFFGGSHQWYFARVLSAVFGTLSLGVAGLFAKRYFRSNWAGFWAMALLAVLPSHVYYSRLALQEALSAFCFISGLYLYCFPRKLNARTFLSGVVFACVFFSNYRMIVLPALVAVCELFLALGTKGAPSETLWQRINVRGYVWSMLTFFSFVFLLGAVGGGMHTRTTFSWMFYQEHLAEGHFDLLNFLSFPYYLFRLESVFFGLLFFANIYFFVRRQWDKAMPFAVVLTQMIIFSLPEEKALRYLAVGMPLMAVAVTPVIMALWTEKKLKPFRSGVILLTGVLFSSQMVKSNTVAHFHADYTTVMNALLRRDPNVKVIATQHFVHKLYTARDTYAYPPQHEVKNLMHYALRGYEFLIIDPQAYVAYTKNKERFTLPLEDHLEFILEHVKPLKVYPHFSPDLLERFVFEHSSSFRQSLAFLKANTNGRLGVLRLYGLKNALDVMSIYARAPKDQPIDHESFGR